jgi:hypothetical protein
LNFGIWIRDDGWAVCPPYRIKVTIRYKVRRSERFVERTKKSLPGLLG